MYACVLVKYLRRNGICKKSRPLSATPLFSASPIVVKALHCVVAEITSRLEFNATLLYFQSVRFSPCYFNQLRTIKRFAVVWILFEFFVFGIDFMTMISVLYCAV